MKKLWIGLIILVVVVIVVVVGIRLVTRSITGEKVARIMEKTVERVAKEAEVTVEKIEAPAKPAKEVSAGKMNDDIWVEVFAYSQYRTAKYAEETGKIKDVADMARVGERYAKDIENMYKKFGVTEDEFGAYTEKLAENPEHYTKLVERVGKRVEELQKAGK